jgi:hypothetical protein
MAVRPFLMSIGIVAGLVSLAHGQGTLTCEDTEKNRAAIITACNKFQAPEELSKIDQIVCINDFQYNPAVITPRVGDTRSSVAANVERVASGRELPVRSAEPARRAVKLGAAR